MEFIARVLLVFVFIQFLVLVAVMVATLLLAHPEAPILGQTQWGRRILMRGLATIKELPNRTVQAIVRLLRMLRLHGAW